MHPTCRCYRDSVPRGYTTYPLVTSVTPTLSPRESPPERPRFGRSFGRNAPGCAERAVALRTARGPTIARFRGYGDAARATLRREVEVDGKRYVATLTPEGLRLVEKGRRKGIEITWKQILDGEVELHAQLAGSLARPAATQHDAAPTTAPIEPPAKPDKR